MFKKIAALLGWTEVPETSEGLHLQPEEASAIENALQTEDEKNTAAQALTAATEQVTTLTDEVETLTNAATAAAQTATANATRISELETEVTRLGGESSGKKGSSVNAAKIETANEKTGNTVRFDDPEHPMNVAAARYAKTQKK